MPNLTNLTDEACDFLFELLKREENHWQSPAGGRAGDNDSADQETRERILKDLLWRLEVVRSSKTASDKEFENLLLEERLAGYC